MLEALFVVPSFLNYAVCTWLSWRRRWRRSSPVRSDECGDGRIVTLVSDRGATRCRYASAPRALWSGRRLV